MVKTSEKPPSGEQDPEQPPPPENDDDAAAALPLVEIADPSQSKQQKEAAQEMQLSGLTKEQLEAYVNDPFWRRLRLATLCLFAALWLCMFVAVIVIVVASPKCPPRPTRQFWQRPVYRLQLAAFAPAGDSDSSAVGSLTGLASRLTYLRDTLGMANFLIGGNVNPVAPKSGCPTGFAAIRPQLGQMSDLRTLAKRGRKKGFNLMLELDLSQADPDWSDKPDAFFRSPWLGKLSRDSKPAWRDGRLHLPRSACDSLNVSSPTVRSRLGADLTAWLDAGVSGFLLNNVAFMAPSRSDSPPIPPAPSLDWFATSDPSSTLYSNDSVEFVRWARGLLDQEAGRLGRDLALFVDPGNTGFSQPTERLAAYLAAGAHAVVSIGLGRPLSDKSPAGADAANPRRLVESVLAAVGNEAGSVMFATAWPSLRRPADPMLTALSLTLPGVPCLYYGQELGMVHVPGVRFKGNASLSSYLSGNDSTDPSETPMQWSGSAANAGWLSDAGTRLDWVDLQPRAADIQAHNLRRLAASGHPSSALQFVRGLLDLVGSAESLQWGSIDFLPTPAGSSPGLLAFRRRAVRFPAVFVVGNPEAQSATLDLSVGEADGKLKTGTLKLMHTAAGRGGAGGAYKVGQSYGLDRVFVPAFTTLVFLAD